MPDLLPAGPYRHLELAEGLQVPYYVIPFGKRGLCEAPLTRQHLLDALGEEDYSDVFLFSHGWNNDWTVATRNYESFISGYVKMRQDYDLPVPAGYRPLLVGIFWPSTSLVFGEDEKGPKMAAGDPAAADAAIGEERRAIRELADELADSAAERFFALVQKERLEPAEAEELAVIGHELCAADPELGDGTPTAEDLLAAWATLDEPEKKSGFEDFGAPGTKSAGATSRATEGPRAAGILSGGRALDPRWLVRVFTVYQMKDRAGRIGERGVAPLLRDLLAASPARLHLVGHSFGAKVMLAAVSAGDEIARQVDSMLLLQPAVSHLCFADALPGGERPGDERPGGYRIALDRVRSPIFSTFSENDVPLTRLFHLALRRERDLGEPSFAAAEQPPSRFAALGGFGPRRAGERLIELHDAAEVYDLEPGVAIYGLRGHRTIHGHGDVSNESTWWALHSLVARMEYAHG